METEQNAALEQEARDYGWVPKEEFKGPEDKWRPAEDYVPWAKQVGRLPKSEFDALKREFPVLRNENKELKDKLSNIEGTLKEFVDFSSKAEQRAYERAKRELEQKAEAAAANADPAGVRQAMQELEALKTEPKPAPKQEAPKTATEVDPIIQDWISKEEWFTRDRSLNAYATDIYGDLERSKPGVSRADLLAETKRKTMEKFPEKFGINPARDGAPAVGAPSGTVRAPKRGKTYDDLPAEAKAACDRFVKQIPGYTRERYVKEYDWDI